jgi:hypothetical protein
MRRQRRGAAWRATDGSNSCSVGLTGGTAGCASCKPSKPCRSIEYCQARNSSTEREYRLQASSSGNRPPRTAATTSALRRITQRTVPSAGRSAIDSGLPSGPITNVLTHVLQHSAGFVCPHWKRLIGVVSLSLNLRRGGLRFIAQMSFSMPSGKPSLR